MTLVLDLDEVHKGTIGTSLRCVPICAVVRGLSHKANAAIITCKFWKIISSYSCLSNMDYVLLKRRPRSWQSRHSRGGARSQVLRVLLCLVSPRHSLVLLLILIDAFVKTGLIYNSALERILNLYFVNQIGTSPLT